MSDIAEAAIVGPIVVETGGFKVSCTLIEVLDNPFIDHNIIIVIRLIKIIL